VRGKQACSAGRLCATSYENDSDRCATSPPCYVCQRPSSQRQARAAQSWEYRLCRASSPAQPGRCCGVNCYAIKHNGLLHEVLPVTALKLRLVATPLRCATRPAGSRNPRYVLRPLRPARVARRSLRVAPSHTPDIHWPACPCLRHRHRCSGQALRAVRGVGPAHPLGPGAYAPLARAGQGPSAPKGLPPARRCAVVALRGGGRHRACSSAVMHGSLRLAWPTPSLL